MEIDELKIWQWILAGLIAGGLFSCIYAWNGPPFDTQPRDTIEQGEFENNAMAATKFGTAVGPQMRLINLYHKDQPLLRDVTIHPPIASDPKHYWVTGRAYSIGLKAVDPNKPKGPEKVYEEWRLFKYPASIPYEPGYTLRAEKKLDKNEASRRNVELAALKKALGNQSSFPTVVEYLKAVGSLQNSDLKYQYAWWELPKAKWSLPPIAGVLIFGVAFPMTLSVMRNFGIAKPPVKAVAKPKPQVPTKKPTRAPAPVMPAAVVPTPAPAPALSPGDQRKYGGEFYPVVKNWQGMISAGQRPHSLSCIVHHSAFIVSASLHRFFSAAITVQPRDCGTFLKILATLGLVALNAYFVAVEFAAVSARVGRLKPLTQQSFLARAAMQVKDHLSLYLSSCQLGNTLAALALGAVTEPAVGSLVAPLTAMLHLTGQARVLVAFLLSFSIAVALHIVIGEQAPKNLSIRYADRILMPLAPPLIVFTYLFYPAIWLLNASANGVLRLVGVPPHTRAETMANWLIRRRNCAPC